MAPPRSRPAFFVVFVLPLGRLPATTCDLLFHVQGVAVFLSCLRFVVLMSHTGDSPRCAP